MYLIGILVELVEIAKGDPLKAESGGVDGKDRAPWPFGIGIRVIQ